jgi:hypothetical protein
MLSSVPDAQEASRGKSMSEDLTEESLDKFTASIAKDGPIRMKIGTYFATKTLLGGGPDINKRIIHRFPKMEVICVLNPHMDEWTEKDEQRLQVILNALNAEEKRAAERRAEVK